MEQITRQERNSILFYQGAVEYISLNSSEYCLKNFYQAPNAYEGMNTLLFPGISNEESRIREEKREIPSVLLDNVPELLKVYCNLYTAMCKYTYCRAQKGSLYTYRSDRINTLMFLQQGKTVSFLSTSLENTGNSDFHKKSGILLLEIEAPDSVVHLDVNEVLGRESAYPDEREILFPPFLQLDLESLDLTEAEKQYRDMNNEMPKAKYKMVIRDNDSEAQGSACVCVDLRKLYGEILEQESIDMAKKVWEDLSKGETLQEDAVKQYQKWKKKIQLYLERRFFQIKKQIFGIQPDLERRQKLEQDMEAFYVETDRQRIKYKNQLKKLNIALSVLYPLSSLAISLSFLECLDPWAKIAGLLFSTTCVILGGIGASLTIEEKWQQRTTTYLRLDELRRDMKYETDWNREKTERYIDKFKDIIKADDAVCESNTKISANYFKTMSKGKNDSDK